ncbi:MAG: hypothetical protein F6K44_33690 [Moorea sp. SIO3E2]|nr:hypothetical protein [Moorena sp. SIO3E2]
MVLELLVLFRRGGASRVVNKAYRVSEAMAGVGKKPALYRACQRREYVTKIKKCVKRCHG